MEHEFMTIPFNAALQNAALNFDCGSSPFYNQFIRGWQALDASFGKTFVFLTEDQKSIVGYYNIGVGEVSRDDGYQRLKSGGAVHINVLALDKSLRGKTALEVYGADIPWSDLLLYDCLKRINKIRDTCVGFSFVTLSASKEGYSLYRRFDFFEMDEDMSFNLQEDEKSGKGIMMYLALDSEDP